MSPPDEPQTESDGPAPARASRRRAWIALALVGGAALAAGLGWWRAASRSTSAAAPQKLSIALSSTPHAALLHLAVAQGYFAEEGLELEIVPVSHGKAALDLLAQGRTDLAAAAEVPFVVAVLKGAPFGLVASVVSTSSEMAVVARRDRAIAAPGDLAGKRVGVTLGTSGEYFLWAFLIRHRLAPERVTLVDTPPGQMAQALARGAIDAASTWQPVRFSAESALGDNGLSFTEPNAYTVTHVLVGHQALLQRRAVAIERLVRAVLRAERYLREQPEPALASVAARLKLDTLVLRAGWTDLDLRVDLLQSQLVTLEDEARWAMARGYAEPRPVPNFLPHLYPNALLAVRPERVTVVR